MRILVISQYYFPEDFRINDICEGLVARGHEVTVVTGIPTYPHGYVFEGYEKSSEYVDTRNGVKILRCNNKPRKKGAINLIKNYVSYVKCANKILKKLDATFDIVYVYQMSPISLALPGIKYKKRHHIPLYLYVCDIWPESVRDLAGGKIMSVKNPIYSYAKRFSKKIYKKADRIGVKCEEFIDYLETVCKVKREKCEVIYEHAESSYLSVNEYSINNGVVDLMFLGNIGHSSNCDSIVKAVKSIGESCNNFIVHFVGDGSELGNIKALSEELQVEDKIVFHGRCPQEAVNDYYELADICLLTLSCKTAVGMTPPAKLTSYMAACRPIIASIDGAARNIIQQAQCGLVVPADDIDGFANIIRKAIEDESVIKDFGMNGRKYFLDNFTLDKHIESLEKSLKDLCGVQA